MRKRTPEYTGPCIYCRAEAPAVTFEGREHVIPQAFGLFSTGNLVLRTVCDGCNHYFSHDLDEPLARGSWEGLQRYSHGQADPRALRGKAVRERVRTTAKSGPWIGMHVEQRPSPDGTQVWVEPLQQVGFAKSAEGPYTFFLSDDIPRRQALGAVLGEGPFFAKAMRFDDAALRERLKERGFTQTGDVTPGVDVISPGTVIKVGHVSTADRTVLRAVAKISFNYFACLSPQLVLLAQFDPVRDFVRFDRGERKDVIELSAVPIVDNRSRGRVGHAVTVRVDQSSGRVVGEVSLYSGISYRVALASTPFFVSVPVAGLETGHFFDPHRRTVSPLVKGADLLRRLVIQ